MMNQDGTAIFSFLKVLFLLLKEDNMKKLKSYEIRDMWLNFFKSKGHYIEPGANLIPHISNFITF